MKKSYLFRVWGIEHRFEANSLHQAFMMLGTFLEEKLEARGSSIIRNYGQLVVYAGCEKIGEKKDAA